MRPLDPVSKQLFIANLLLVMSQWPKFSVNAEMKTKFYLQLKLWITSGTYIFSCLMLFCSFCVYLTHFNRTWQPCHALGCLRLTTSHPPICCQQNLIKFGKSDYRLCFTLSNLIISLEFWIRWQTIIHLKATSLKKYAYNSKSVC